MLDMGALRVGAPAGRLAADRLAATGSATASPPPTASTAGTASALSLGPAGVTAAALTMARGSAVVTPAVVTPRRIVPGVAPGSRLHSILRGSIRPTPATPSAPSRPGLRRLDLVAHSGLPFPP